MDAESVFEYDPPSVIAIEPGHGSAAGGTMVTIVGNNFGATNNNPSVTIGGRPCQSVVWLSDTKLQCVSPPGIGIGDVRVFVLDLSSPENFGTIFEFDAPQITKLVPDHGPSTGGFTLTVQGLNFGTVDSHPQIKVGGHNCKSTGWKSNEEVYCVVPQGTGLAKQVQVEVLGQPSKPQGAKAVFSYDGPMVTGLDPANGPTIGGTHVTILGENFGYEADKSIGAKLDNIPCSSVSWLSMSSALCIAPPGTGAEKQIQVELDGLKSPACPGTAEGKVDDAKCGALFRYDKPLIADVKPDHGPTSGGYFIRVSGDNYGTTPSSLKLLVGKAACEKTNWISNTVADCLVPPGVGITHVVAEADHQASDPRGTGDLAQGDLFTYDAPLLLRVLPSTGDPGGGQLVTLQGRNFGTEKSEVQVLVGDSPGRVVHVADQQVLMVMPAGEGDRKVTVRVGDQQTGGAGGGAAGAAGGGAAKAPQYDFQGPKVTAVTPDHGPTQGGQTVTVEGKDLGPSGRNLKVEIGGIECIDSRWVSEHQVACTTPPGSGGSKTVTVIVDGEYAASSPPAYSYSYSAPVVRSVVPATGSSDGNTRLLVQGLNFGLTDSHPVAYVGPTRCTATVWTDDAALTCITPAWSRGPVVAPVTVRVDGQTSEATPGGVFQFGDGKAPVITALAWSRAPTDGGFTLTLFGSKFEDRDVSAAVAKYGGGQSPCPHTTWLSQSKVKCVAPAGVGAGLPVTLSSKDFPVASTFGSVSFEYDPPVVTALSASSGAVGGGMRVTITGYGFGVWDSQPTGRIGGEACGRSEWTSDSSLACTTPAGQGHQDLVSVLVGGQESKQTDATPTFAYTGLAITAVRPDFGPTSGGTEVTMLSVDFGDAFRAEGPLRVSLGPSPHGAACEGARWVSSSAVTCKTPAGAGARQDVTVQTEGTRESVGESYQGYGLFSYQRPVVTGVEPREANSAGGLPITVVGRDFGVTDENPRVWVGSTPCSRTLYVSDQKLICVTPPGGGGGLLVRAELNGQSSLGLDVFSYRAPEVRYVEPASGPVTGSTVVTIVGKHFGRSAASDPQGLIGGVPCTRTKWVSDSQAECTAPRGKDLFARHHVQLRVQGVESGESADAQFTYVEAQGGGGGGAEGVQPPGSERGLDGRSGSKRAPGVYLTIAYLVALGCMLGAGACVRLLFSSSKARPKPQLKNKRGLVARAVNRVWSLFFRSQGDSAADASFYHIVDSIDIEMEASSEIDLVEQHDTRTSLL